MKTHILFLFSLVLSLSLFAGCSPQLATRGNLLEDYQMKEVLPGIDQKDDVIRKIGSPTTISPFDENTWYYMGQRTEKKGILDPKVTEERIVVVLFDPTDGLVDKIVERQDGREDVPIVQRKTPTSGNEFTFIQQMLGNVGKFNKQPESAARTAGGGM
ncbi:MAG: outer membrane protein assembly factor BamE [Alphaproteobacteria bacterium]|jgi:outer membrane protein assembly factor BamE (lipoprotein component of BamABCDE complex)|nr:outer membrane protein assembly factor BamE [Alphaproteobacteria bacterium]MCB1551032.1 outer membrane protein assembly factor BamE [Alphaproteobacteria bacterium]MCB9984609.1 outer membrane protein assembly factor BamE [Micavibrio sp.]HPQ50451.1 outer membrane protein assembly factor BamE [Alphaproteobacteria bacterium]HRK97952.1 outer membrane protein assembly factor BamE [Alphaproteobacteria bacterium]